MSQENVEVVRKALEASSRGDWDGFSEALDPAVEWTPVKGDPDYGVHRGIKAVRAWFEPWVEAFPDLGLEAERILDAGGDRVAAIVRQTGSGAASGAKVDYRYGTIFTVRGGKIVAGREYASLRKALEAVGLREQAMSPWQSGSDGGLPDVLAFVQETIEPDVELERLAAIPGTGGTFRGQAGLLAGWQELAEGFEGLRFVPQREFDLGDGRVVVDVLALATGRESGVRTETRLGHLLELREGRVVRWAVYSTLAEALEAMGLPE